MPPLQPRELACLFFSSVHRLVFCGCLSANVRAAGTMATANLEGCKKRNKLQSITSKLCVKTQIRQIGNLLEEFSACQHFCELFQSVNAIWFIPNCFRQSEVVWSCFPQNDDRVFWKEYYQNPHIFSIGLEIKKPRLIQRHLALVLVHLTLFAYSIPFFVCLYCFFQTTSDTKTFEPHVMELVTFYQCPPINPEFHLCSSLFSDSRHDPSSQSGTSHKKQGLSFNKKSIYILPFLVWHFCLGNLLGKQQLIPNFNNRRCSEPLILLPEYYLWIY